MLTNMDAWLPQDAVKILLVLLLSFMIGLEREEHKAATPHFSFGGVRTFPLIGLIGFSLAYLAGGQRVTVGLGFAAVAAFLCLSYWHKLLSNETAGATTEMSALATYLLGALVYYDHYWIATTLGVASLLLLELKAALEKLSRRIAPDEILTFAKFLLLSAVILPVLPDKEFTRFQINPFKTWLVVVAVSAISYGGYVLQRLTKKRGGVALAALLGGAYSSTVTTVALGRRAAHQQQPHLYSGAILMASGMMYLRLTLLLGFFNWSLMRTLVLPFMVLAILGMGAGWLWSRQAEIKTSQAGKDFAARNPLELWTAFLFALLFIVILSVSRLVAVHLGKAGVFSLAALMGVTDVDPFIMGMTQAAGAAIALKVAAAGILIAAASNNIVKGVYAYSVSDRKTGMQSLALLAALAILGLIPLFWLTG